MERRNVIKCLFSFIGGGAVAASTMNKANAAETRLQGLASQSQLIVSSAMNYVDPRLFGAHPVTEKGYDKFDSTDAFQAAIDHAVANNIGTVKFSGKYLIAKPKHKFLTPADDGSISKSLSKSGDANIAPEPEHYLQASLKIPSVGLRLIADDPVVDVLIGGWDIAKSAIDENQLIGIVITSGSKYSGTAKYTMSGFSMKGFFIARIVEGMSESTYEELRFINCGIPGIKQGIERCSEGRMSYVGCLTGDVIGGWWTTRNSTSMDASDLPPYPAKGVNAIGWTDFNYTEELIYAQFSAAFGHRHVLLDEFFDSYFFKSKNSDRSSHGGRLSDLDASHPAVMPNYYGIVGRARTVISRYGRPISSFIIDRMKTLGCHRTPIFYQAPKTYGCIINGAYVERSGLVNNANKSVKNNLFGIDVDDRYRGPGYGIGFTVGHGTSLGELVLSSGNQPARTHDGNGVSIAGALLVNKINYDENPDEVFFSATTFGNKFKRYYRMGSDSFLTQPLKFINDDAESFDYVTGNFTPKLLVNGVETGSAKNTGFYTKIGNIIHVTAIISVDRVSDGLFTIQGLPFSGAVGVESHSSISVVKAKNIKPGLFIYGLVKAGEIALYKDSAGSAFGGRDVTSLSEAVSFEVHGFYRVKVNNKAKVAHE
ncbi:hypothetical protein [Gibbsiella quercinecans]|uniref:hypothetical protein n=1 Tax=Gibbsiella quercinecans TaxID=929813 RepID=UPI00242E118A|nr:hypothetical protein [Gibbsiella quercinecans]